MKKTILAVLPLAAASQLFLAKPAHALTFNFSWTSDNSAFTVRHRGELIPNPPLYTASGRVSIDRNPGQNFNRNHISSINITMTDGSQTASWSDLNDIRRWNGSISASGEFANTRHIVLDAQPNENFNQTFHCNYWNCNVETADVSDFVIDFADGNLATVIDVSSQEALQNSFKLTAVPFGIPDYLPIGFLGVVVGVDLLKKGRSKKKMNNRRLG